jgi:hypothetical protein
VDIEHDLVCTLGVDHEGDHVAHGGAKREVLHTWPRRDGEFIACGHHINPTLLCTFPYGHDIQHGTFIGVRSN